MQTTTPQSPSDPKPGVYRWGPSGKLTPSPLPWPSEEVPLAEFLEARGYSFDERIGPLSSLHLELWERTHPDTEIEGYGPAPDSIVLLNSPRGFRMILCHGPEERSEAMNLLLPGIQCMQDQLHYLAVENSWRVTPKPREQYLPSTHLKGDDFADLIEKPRRQPTTA